MTTNLVGSVPIPSIQAGGPAQPIQSANITPNDTKELVQLVLQLTNSELVFDPFISSSNVFLSGYF
jgi:hypothetical protein